jgi:hypothetical protein
MSLQDRGIYVFPQQTSLMLSPENLSRNFPGERELAVPPCGRTLEKPKSNIPIQIFFPFGREIP